MIVLTPHDPAWAAHFAAAREEIVSACAGLITEVHHIGSTAIPGLAAKPRRRGNDRAEHDAARCRYLKGAHRARQRHRGAIR